MEQVTDPLYFLRYVPLFLAMFFWLYYFFARHTCSQYVDMKHRKQWNDLPRSSTTENKEETLNLIIEARNRQVQLGFRLSVMFSVIAVFWLFYMR